MCMRNSDCAPESIEIGILSSNRRVCQVTSYSYIGTEETGIPYYSEGGFSLTDIQLVALKEFFKSDSFIDACCDATGLVAALVIEAHDKPEDYRAFMISRGDSIYLKIV